MPTAWLHKEVRAMLESSPSRVGYEIMEGNKILLDDFEHFTQGTL